MYIKGDKFPTEKAYNSVIDSLNKRNISIEDIAKITYELQKDHSPNVSVKTYAKNIDEILHRHEVLNNALTAFALDDLAEAHELPEPLQTIVARDFSLFGVDESLAISITNLYGTIGITNFGYVDKVKKGIIRRLDEDKNHVNTFADDIIGAVAVAAGAKVAHAEGAYDNLD